MLCELILSENCDKILTDVSVLLPKCPYLCGFYIDMALRCLKESDIYNLIHSHRVSVMLQKLYCQGIVGEKGMGWESPAITVGVCIEVFVSVI